MTTQDALREMQREIDGLRRQLQPASENINRPLNARRKMAMSIEHLRQASNNLDWAKIYMDEATTILAESTDAT